MQIFKKEIDVLVCGCSKLGAHIANYYSAKGYNVTVLDINKSSFRKLKDDFSGETRRGDATDIDILRYNGIEEAEIVVVTTEKDNMNIFIAEMASIIFSIPKIFVRLNDEDKEELLSDFNNINIISPFHLCMEKFIELENKGGQTHAG